MEIEIVYWYNMRGDTGTKKGDTPSRHSAGYLPNGAG